MLFRAAFILIVSSTALPAAEVDLPTTINYNRHIRPILSDNCFRCHGPDAETREAGLRFDLRDEALKTLESSHVAIVPGGSGQSELVRRITSTDPEIQMPPPDSNRHLSDRDKLLLARWIDEGAEYHPHWAFVPPQARELPAVKRADWARDGLDRFVLARLEAEGLEPSPEADRPTLLRRVTLDLTGLPPTPAEVEAFLADTSPTAYEAAVDRLLASPRYAERMAMAWLDVARYADTHGYNNDGERSQWPWRDWVISAFAANMPYDQFIVEQLAGDLIEGATPQQRLATAFNRNHVITSEGGIIPEEYRVEYVADRVHTTATVFLGLSMQCARCHDHKFDPITQRNYYGFFGFFNSVPEQGLGYDPNRIGTAAPALALPSDAQLADRKRLEERRAQLDAQLKTRETQLAAATPPAPEKPAADKPVDGAGATAGQTATPPTPEQLQAQRKQFEASDEMYRTLSAELATVTGQQAALEKAIPQAMIMEEMPAPRPSFLLKRGQYDQPGEPVSPHVPESLPPLPAGVPANRLGLAKWLIDPGNPLTARVAVNRWWQMYFGTGIVETVEDFGSQGAWPANLELLDWLARELIASGWDVKAMQKRIVTSAAYRQSSRVTPELLERDPKNQLLARGPRFRLPAETVRDNALAISGLLVERLGGPSVRPYQPEGLWLDVSVERSAVYKQDTDENLYRRSMYTFWKRTCPPPGMATFDAPDRETCLIRRARTNTPLQALVLMNDPTYVEAARKLAERVLTEGDTAPQTRLDRAFLLAVSRPAQPAEAQLLLALVEETARQFRAAPQKAESLIRIGQSVRDAKLDPAELAAWTTAASVILNLDETISKE